MHLPILDLNYVALSYLHKRVHTAIFKFAQNLENHVWVNTTVVLTWLTVPQESFKMFILNRLARIADLLPDCK